MDAILHVVRCFVDNDIVHVEGTVDPIRDIDTIDTELALADLETVSVGPGPGRAAGPHRRQGRPGPGGPAEADQGPPERGQGRSGRWTCRPTTARRSAAFGLITAKKVLYVANVAEDDVHGRGPLVQVVRDRAAAEGGTVVPVCGKLEAELSELPEADRAEMLAGMDLAEPALATLTREAYALLGRQSYFTAGPQEVRAWEIPVGATAPQAAGVIHTDFEKKFIRAEVYGVDDLVALKTEQAIKAAGKMRSEGKAYVMRDGDVCNFLTGA